MAALPHVAPRIPFLSLNVKEYVADLKSYPKIINFFSLLRNKGLVLQSYDHFLMLGGEIGMSTNAII